jgi:threonine dehydrogenase-like Zn-dependent dehydrogenase
MQALLLTDTGPKFAADYPKPQPAPGEALIRITRAGICNTDQELIKGYKGYRGVLGHEFVGVVEEVNASQSAIQPGMRVVGEINATPPGALARNWFERSQDPSRVTLGIYRLDGVFAEYARLPLANLHIVPDSVSDDEAVFTEPLAAACNILEQVHIKPTDRVAVLGNGKLGALCALVINTVPCNLTVFGRHPAGLQFLREQGIHTTRLMADSELPDLSRLNLLRSFDVVVEVTGSASGFETARQLLRPRGTLVLKSTYAGLPQVDMTMIVVDEITIVGSRCGPFAPALRLMAQKRVNVLPMIHARYPLKNALSALQKSHEKGVLKVLLDI